MTTKAVIIGAGFVGGTLYKAIHKLEDYEISIYDKDKENCKLAKEVENIQWADLIREMNADIYFICLPTPMVVDVGAADLSLITHWVNNLTNNARGAAEIVIKSTVPPGSTKNYNNTYGGGIFFNPEFLTEKNALNDFINLPYQIIGSSGHAKPRKTKKLFEDAYKQGLLKCKDIYETDATTAELVKYTRNCYLATRISFFNEINQICENLNISYDDVKNLAGLDERVGNHYNVIDKDEPEFSGHCLPKDINALIYKMKSWGLKPTLLEGAWNKNLEVAKKKTWETMEGRAVTNKKSEFAKDILKKHRDKNNA